MTLSKNLLLKRFWGRFKRNNCFKAIMANSRPFSIELLMKPVLENDPRNRGACALLMALQRIRPPLENITKEAIMEATMDEEVAEVRSERQGIRLALFAAGLGLEVQCHTYNMRLFLPSDEEMDREKLLQSLHHLAIDDSLRKELPNLSNYDRFLKYEKANLRVAPPSMDTLREFLSDNVPVVLLANPRIACGRPTPLEDRQYVLITGFRGTNFTFVDFCEGEFRTIDERRLQTAVDAAAVSASAYLITVRKQQG
jgi:hypothetical protein